MAAKLDWAIHVVPGLGLWTCLVDWVGVGGWAEVAVECHATDTTSALL